MKKFLISFSIFIVWSVFGLWLYTWMLSDSRKNISKMEVLTDTISETAKEALKGNKIDSIINKKQLNTSVAISPSALGLKAINAEGDVIFQFSEGIAILENSNEVLIPESVYSFKEKIYTYLLENPEQEVHINSLYSASENFESPNYGMKRGEKIKEILLKTKVPKEKIVIKPIIIGINFSEEGFKNNGITFIFKPLDYKRIVELKTSIPDKKIVYPEFSSTGIEINKNLVTLLTEVKQIVLDNPDVKIDIIGHTDNIGSSVDNQITGLNYAKQVRWYLISKGGFDKSKINALSKGESEPIDTNHSERGRNANRRIEVIFY